MKKTCTFLDYLPYCSGLTIFYKNSALPKEEFALTLVLTFNIPLVRFLPDTDGCLCLRF